MLAVWIRFLPLRAQPPPPYQLSTQLAYVRTLPAGIANCFVVTVLAPLTTTQCSLPNTGGALSVATGRLVSSVSPLTTIITPCWFEVFFVPPATRRSALLRAGSSQRPLTISHASKCV